MKLWYFPSVEVLYPPKMPLFYRIMSQNSFDGDESLIA